MTRILFVCHGNICRSPMAEFCRPDHPRPVADPWYSRDFAATWRDVLDGCTALLRRFADATGRGGQNR